MYLAIENIRKSLCSISTWLTTNDHLRFLKDEKNKPATINSIELARQLPPLSNKCRTFFNQLSNAIEDYEICMRNLRIAIEREKETRKRNKEQGIR